MSDSASVICCYLSCRTFIFLGHSQYVEFRPHALGKKKNLQSRQHSRHRAIKPDVTQLSDWSQCKAAPAVSKLAVSAVREHKHAGTSQTCAESITGDRC